MIKRKLKPCLDCKKPSVIWSKGKCKACFHLDKNYKIPKVSEKMKANLDLYAIVRRKFLEKHSLCEAKLKGCLKNADQVHHLKGREGKLLTDKNFFMAVCGACHRKIEDGGEWVYELGFKIRRI